MIRLCYVFVGDWRIIKGGDEESGCEICFRIWNGGDLNENRGIFDVNEMFVFNKWYV